MLGFHPLSDLPLSDIADLGGMTVQTPVFQAPILPPAGFRYVTFTGIDSRSFLNDPRYNGNAGGDANNIGVSDQGIHSEVTTPGGYNVVMNNVGLFTITGDGLDNETESQFISFYYLDAQDGYKAGPLMTLEVFVGSASDVSVNVPPGQVSYTGQVSSVEVVSDTVVNTPAGQIDFTGQVSTVELISDTVINTPAGQIGFVGQVSTIELIDNQAPVITLLGDSVVTIMEGTAYVDAGATALDNVDGNITADIVTVNPVDINTVDTYIITYNVSDAAGLAAGQVTRTVNVIPVPTPVINLVGGNVVRYVDTGFTEPGYAANDPLDGDITGDVVVTGTVDTSTPGNYYLYYNVDNSISSSAIQRVRTVTIIPARVGESPRLTKQPIKRSVKRSLRASL